MRKLMAGIVALLLIQSGLAEILITAQDYAVDSDVVLETAVKEVKSTPRDTVNVIGDSIKYVSDETVTAAKGVAAVFKSDPVEKAERAAALETASAWDSSNDIQFRSYKVTDEVGEELTQGADVPSGSAVDASGFFTGIEFPEGASAWYRPGLVPPRLQPPFRPQYAGRHSVHRRRTGRAAQRRARPAGQTGGNRN